MIPALLWRTLLATDASTLVYGKGAEMLALRGEWAKGSVLDLRRQAGIEWTAPQLRTTLLQTWENHPVLCVAFDAVPAPSVMSVLYEAARRALNVSPSKVVKPTAGQKLIGFTGAPSPQGVLSRAFPLRIFAARLQPSVVRPVSLEVSHAR